MTSTNTTLANAYVSGAASRSNEAHEAALLAAYGRCVICDGRGWNDTGTVTLSGATSRRTCVACQGQRLFGGWGNQFFKDVKAAATAT